MRFWDKENEDARELARSGVEVWAPTHISPERYFVSNLGNVISSVAGRGYVKLSPVTATTGRYTVGLYLKAGDPKSVTWLVHRLVLYAFDGVPPTPEHTDGCHGVGGEKDNRLCNLEWGTRSKNMKDVIAHKRERPPDRLHAHPKESASDYHKGALLTATQVEAGVKLYNEKKASISDLAAMWGCNQDAARNALVGRTRAHNSVVREGRASMNGRIGENHFKAVCTDAELAHALEQYVLNKWSGVQFAKYLGIKQITAHFILSGKNRSNVPKPEGFQYPWPDAPKLNRNVGENHGCAKITEKEILEVFQRVEAGEFQKVSQIQEVLGISRGMVYGILSGRSWSHLPRSDSFKAALAKIQRKPRSTGPVGQDDSAGE